ncbi:hypothetical protein GQ53DRAFT_130277 [Thozetella sp. PMI_491]|nr:hypothetical protein GQ53DRAFT_130277 [Thozetella sp. PMI_491]
MLRSAFVWALALLGLVSSSFDADTCTNQTWTIKDFKAKYGAEVREGGSASFTLLDNVTGKSAALTCSLRANSRCEVAGTTNDKNVHIFIQTTIDTLLVTVNDTLTCDGKSSVVIRTATLEMECTESPKTCSVGSGVINVSPNVKV